ncbi:MAG: hypothetical protein II982_02585 [Clostridia bacterium]|nr:hypothetical protein [Clostridia bacterium]
MKRFLAIFIALVMLFSFAACTGSNDGEKSGKTHEYTTGYDKTKYNAPGVFPIFKEKQTITVTAPDNAKVEDFETNAQTLMYEEQLNADLVFTILPSKEYTTKLNLMAAAGGDEFTDVIINSSFSDGMVMNLAEAEVIVPLTEYFYNTDIAWNLQEAKERLDWDFYPYITMTDGEIYGPPVINDSPSNCNSAKLWVYEPWFDAAGIELSSIKTTEDFKNAMRAVVKSDPNGNGKADEVGLTAYATTHSWQDWLMNAFIYSGEDNYIYVKDGKLGFAYTQEEWREGLRYIKELYDLGLIDPLAFSQDSTGYKAMLNYEDTIVTAFVGTQASNVAENDPRRVEYTAIAPLNSSWNDGKPLSSQTLPEPKSALLVTLNAEDPEVGFRLGDLMVSEESSIHTRWGVKGKDWLVPDEDDVALYAALGYKPTLVEVLPYGAVQNSHWNGIGPWIRQKSIAAGTVWSGNPLDTNVKIAEAQMLYNDTNPEEDIVKLIYTEEENEIISAGLANCKTYADQAAAQFVTGTLDLDKDWDAYIKQLDAMNVAGVLECAQAAYDRMK